MADYVVLEAPSVLGLFPGGVERLPAALIHAGLADALTARHAGVVVPPAYDARRDPVTGLRNPTALRDYAHQLAAATGAVLDAGDIPIVLGGDCSILLGNLLALHRRGRHGLLFIDGHADFYQPAAEPNGEAASMDLALATVRQRRAEPVARDALARLVRPGLDGVWIHLDCDALDDAIMPAVDYRLPDGLRWDELQAVLDAAGASGAVAGIEVTIFNPTLDPDGSIARALVTCLSGALVPGDPSDVADDAPMQ